MDKHIDSMTEEELEKHLEKLKLQKYELECSRAEVASRVDDISTKILDEYKPINQ